jgi:hypothetical protein
LTNAFIREVKGTRFDIIIDYVWGGPTEALLAAITGADLALRGSRRVRLIQVGESAGQAISLPAAALRSSGLEIMGAGSGAVPPMDVLEGAFQQVLARAAQQELRIEVEKVALGLAARDTSETGGCPVAAGPLADARGYADAPVLFVPYAGSYVAFVL